MLKYVPDFMPASIFLIGAGGTGSRLMPALAQLVRTCLKKYNPNAWLDKLPIFVIDGDSVEEKNLLRQNFIQRDVGQYKSVVLANRYSTAFDIPIYASTQFVGNNPRENLSFIGLPEGLDVKFDSSIIILALDSANARRQVLSYLFNLHNIHAFRGHIAESPHTRCVIVDAGNEDSFGQVRMFTPSFINGTNNTVRQYLMNCPKQFAKDQVVDFIPMDVKMYEQLGESTQELSCVDLPQTLAINAMMSTLILSMVQNVLFLKPMAYDCIRFSLDGSLAVEYNTPRAWAKRAYDISSDGYYAANTPLRKLNLFKDIHSSILLSSFRYVNLNGDSSTGASNVLHAYKMDQLKEYMKLGIKIVDGEMVMPKPEPTPEPVKVSPPKDVPKLNLLDEIEEASKMASEALKPDEASIPPLMPLEAAMEPLRGLDAPIAPLPPPEIIVDTVPRVRIRRAPPPLR
jgi:molybdopterin/thiamine biosynthesis adenylyltransferase